MKTSARGNPTAPGKHTLILPLTLSSVIPLLVAAFGLYAAMLPPDPGRQARDLPWLLALLGLAALSTVASGVAP